MADSCGNETLATVKLFQDVEKRVEELGMALELDERKNVYKLTDHNDDQVLVTDNLHRLDGFIACIEHLDDGSNEINTQNSTIGTR